MIADAPTTAAELKRVQAVLWEASIERDRLLAVNAELVAALGHCRNVIHEHLQKPGVDLDGFMRGAEDAARSALAKVEED